MIVYLSEPHLATDLFVLTLFLSGVPVPPISVGGGAKCPGLDNGVVSALYSEFHAHILLYIQSSAETK